MTGICTCCCCTSDARNVAECSRVTRTAPKLRAVCVRAPRPHWHSVAFQTAFTQSHPQELFASEHSVHITATSELQAAPPSACIPCRPGRCPKVPARIRPRNQSRRFQEAADARHRGCRLALQSGNCDARWSDCEVCNPLGVTNAAKMRAVPTSCEAAVMMTMIIMMVVAAVIMMMS